MDNESEISIPCLTDEQMVKLVDAAEQVALRFSSPVYLVGSSLSELYPNDIDIFIAVDSDQYLRMFTNYNRKTESDTDHTANIVAMQIQQAKIYKKSKDYFKSRVKGWDFDVKFQNIEQFLQHEKPVLRLDSVYKELW